MGVRHTSRRTVVSKSPEPAHEYEARLVYVCEVEEINGMLLTAYGAWPLSS